MGVRGRQTEGVQRVIESVLMTGRNYCRESNKTGTKRERLEKCSKNKTLSDREREKKKIGEM